MAQSAAHVFHSLSTSLAIAVTVLISIFSVGAHGLEADSLPGWLGETHRMQKTESPSKLTEPRVIKLSWKPRAFLYRSFLSEAECDHIMNVATPTLERSTVVDYASGKSVVDDYRSSWGTFLDKAKDEVIAAIEDRIATWTFLPVENQEAMQVLRYSVSQKYESHHDFFDEKDSLQQGGHRYATVLMYLNHVSSGGETVFPDSEKDPTVKDDSWAECGKRGVAVKPKKGDALLFFSLHPDAKEDLASLHAGCPVIEGEKWSATKWIHVRNFDEPLIIPKDCVDDDRNCKSWANAGECEKNPDYMVGTKTSPGSCRRSCGVCIPPRPSD